MYGDHMHGMENRRLKSESDVRFTSQMLSGPGDAGQYAGTGALSPPAPLRAACAGCPVRLDAKRNGYGFIQNFMYRTALP